MRDCIEADARPTGCVHCMHGGAMLTALLAGLGHVGGGDQVGAARE